MLDQLSEDRLSITEVAQKLRVHTATVYRWVNSGVKGRRLPTLMIGGRRFVLTSDLEDFVQSDGPKPQRSPTDKSRNMEAQRELRRLGIVKDGKLDNGRRRTH